MANNVSIIVPTYNEQGNVIALIDRIHTTMINEGIDYEVIFIDDNSTDLTRESVYTKFKTHPVRLFVKEGKKGKAFSILEGVKKAQYENVCMIDADLQYPPEVIPQMLALIDTHGIIVAGRKDADVPTVRKVMSQTFSFTFGRLLHGFTVDVQSGLKLFKKEIAEFVDHDKVTPWTLDLALLITAKNLGYSVGEVEMTFDKRQSGESKINIFKSSYEIASNAVKQKFNQQKTFHIKPREEGSMVHAGVVHKKKRLITHTTLDPQVSAMKTFTVGQIIAFAMFALILFVGFIINPLITSITLLAFITSIYFADVLFNFYVVYKSLHHPPELLPSDEEINSLKDEDLPVYTVHCPLYKEAHILPQFLENIAKVDWPKSKLEVLILLEEDDKETQEAAKNINIPHYVKIVVVPNSQPKTKPKACNYGLHFTTGEYLVIYDAEDMPDADQLKKAYLGFKNSPDNVVCLQGKLNYFNPSQNLLTRFFTAEYSLWFDVILPGLQTVQTALPLGGTSNHFKVNVLRELKGWDPFNVTEDCDLGIRLFKKGYKTAMIDSTTLEEANSNTKNWLRQRSRWIKGYMQTYLVHMRNPYKFFREFGVHALLFQLIIGARISFMLINPILWLMTVAYFTLFAFVGPAIEALFPSYILYMAVFSLIFGNFLYIYNYMIGVAKREHWTLMKFVFLIPLYWLLASIAATIAFYQLLTKPHYWEKTNHGLHIKKAAEEKKIEVEGVALAS